MYCKFETKYIDGIFEGVIDNAKDEKKSFEYVGAYQGEMYISIEDKKLFPKQTNGLVLQDVEQLPEQLK